MTLSMFDLAGADPALRFSPFCWRTKMVLAHKGLAFATVPWRFNETAVLAPSGQSRVPVLVHDGHWISDSWTIARYLDSAFPEKPVFANEMARAQARLMMSWCDMVLNPALIRYALLAVYDSIDEADRAYFRSSREQRLGMSLEATGVDPLGARKAVASTLAPVEQTLADHAFLGGATPTYADYSLFGSLMWPHVVCREPLLDPASHVAIWFERMLDLQDGFARKAPTRRN